MVGRPFQKGQSGNPGGKSKEREDLRAFARTFTTEAVECLAKLMRKGKSETARHAAASTLLERGWGKPLQQVEVKRSPLDGLTTEQLVTYLAAVESALAVAGDDPEKLAESLAAVVVAGNA